MLRSTIIPIAVLACSLALQTQAQYVIAVPAPPATKLEAIETNLGVVLLKAATDLGSISTRNGMVAVGCRETTDTSTGRKEQGVSVALIPKGQPSDPMLIDYDEIPSLVAALNYLSGLRVNVTPLNTVDAAYTTKGGFRIAALGNRLTGTVQFGIRDVRNNNPPLLFSATEMSLFSNLIGQAKTTLDSLRRG